MLSQDERLHHYPWCESHNMTVTKEHGKSVITRGTCTCDLGKLVNEFRKDSERENSV